MLAYGSLLMDGFIDESGPWGADTINGAVGQVLAIFLLAVIIYRTWRRPSSTASGSGGEPVKLSSV